MLALRYRPRRPRRARRLAALAGLVALLTLLAPRLLPAVAGTQDPVWPGGVVNVYDASDMTDTVITAAARWTHSGADVKVRVVEHEQDADVVVRVANQRLIGLCGLDCLGYSTSIGRPKDGHSEVLLRGVLGGEPRPLSVWVVAHELGHVLGLHHRSGHDCTVMSPRAFDTNCAPSLADLASDERRAGLRACAGRRRRRRGLYGGAATTRDPRCR